MLKIALDTRFFNEFWDLITIFFFNLNRTDSKPNRQLSFVDRAEVNRTDSYGCQTELKKTEPIIFGF